jgi:hypothetical protein
VVALAWLELGCGARSGLLPGSNAVEAGGSAAVTPESGGTTAGGATGSGAGGTGGAGGAIAGAAGATPVGVPLVEPELGDACAVRQVAGDAMHTCAVSEAHELHCWGDNSFYQLGDGTQIARLTPGPSVMSGVRTVTVTGGTTCAVKWTGELLCWGINPHLLGNAAQPEPLQQRPTQVMSGVIDVGLSSYSNSMCALTSTGGVRCWGSTFDGISGYDAHFPPTQDALSGVRSISESQNTSTVCAVTTANTLRCWGEGEDGVPGRNPDRSSKGPKGDLLTGVQSVALGPFASCVVTSSGGLRCWGEDPPPSDGAPGIIEGPTPPDHDSMTEVAAVSVSNWGGCVLTNQGGVRCWGAPYADDGVSSMPDRDLMQGARSVLAVNARACAITNEGALYCWGQNNGGEFGDGGLDRSVPIPHYQPVRIKICP